ncbi:nucleoside-diphosphate-sugar epimerase [Herbinix hemicellulosilytica]|uniref:NAD-dependent epimerase/dehydratase domain-containing protein n=1 Tax=Herbinix hemicellulosilytica TaxID=1564487 RepID=A0A0H5SUV4_HERHM|nr:NAD-dependent epimerase/dehydratase family protein [Herbinix hemicellulosilytica]RBP58366.1 nucleoside-diphosphate-sugar epimerase [Herbinix hemicellulosilytica]CRZ34083.1 hypothetical protein HHT355_0880 [Herbinix hemicellulosilytica]
MRILLIGGTGAIGTHLANVLAEMGHTVVVTSRKPHESKGLIEYRQGNAKNTDFLISVLRENWDTIVDFMNYTTNEFSQRVGLLLNFTSQYIFLSSARVYEKNKEAITEESLRLLDSSTDEVYLSTDEYALSKAREENMLRSAHKRNWVIIRPYITYSESRLQLGNFEKEHWLYRALKGRTIVFSKDINNRLTTLTYGLDVAKGIASLVGNTDTLGEIYNITCDYTVKWSEILDIYLDTLEEKLGYRPKVIYQDLETFLKWNEGKYQIIYDRLFDRKFNCSKINKYINTKDFIHVREGLRKCLNEFLSEPRFGKINWKLEAIKDRYTGERTPLSEINGYKQKLKYLLYRYLKVI